MTKSSIMLGLGEKESEVIETFKELRTAGVSILVISQYLQPTMENTHVVEYISPEKFDILKDKAYALGFDFVVASPFARSSYCAEEAYKEAVKKNPPPSPFTKGD